MQLDALISFVEFTNRFNSIKRSMYIKGTRGYENDAEHATQIALVAWFLANTYNLSLDQEKLIKMALAHDLVEIYAGDTNVYEKDASYVSSKHERETQAVSRIKEEFSHFTDLHSIIEEYEALASEEAFFIKSLDKLVPGINVYVDGGRYWKDHNVTLPLMIDKCATKASSHPDLKVLWEELVERLRKEERHFFESNQR